MLYKTVMPRMPQITSFIQIGKSAINSLLEKIALPSCAELVVGVSGRTINAAEET